MQQCVPSMLALLTDLNVSTSQKARDILETIDDKFPHMIINRVVDGIKLSYTFQMQTYGKFNGKFLWVIITF
jgi:hypothetical protein